MRLVRIRWTLSGLICAIDDPAIPGDESEGEVDAIAAAADVGDKYEAWGAVDFRGLATLAAVIVELVVVEVEEEPVVVGALD